jgi:hypothetical protein
MALKMALADPKRLTNLDLKWPKKSELYDTILYAFWQGNY